MTLIVLYGGGLDSAALVEYLVSGLSLRPGLVYIDWGCKARRGEKDSLHLTAAHHRLRFDMIDCVDFCSTLFSTSPLIQANMVHDHAQNYVPFRNLLFATIAGAYCARIRDAAIGLGFHAEPEGSVYHDAKREFLEQLNSLMRFSYPDHQVRFFAPFARLERWQYLAKAMETRPGIFEETFSCYESGRPSECGRCTHCVQKRELKVRAVEALKSKLGTWGDEPCVE